MKKKLRIGDVIDVTATRLTRIGDGFVRYYGFPIFIKNVDIGWRGKVVIKKIGPSFAIAEPYSNG